MNNLALSVVDLINNPTTRLPVCLVLDTSSSMQTIISSDSMKIIGRDIIDGNEVNIVEAENAVTRIDLLNQGLHAFFNAILDDEMARESAEISIISFSQRPNVALDFTRVSSEMKSIELEVTGGATSLGKAIDCALDLLELRKESYKNAGVDYYQPWLVLLTDGEPTDSTHLQSSNRVKRLIKEKRLSFFPIGIGDDDFTEVDKLSNKKTIRLKGTKFNELFEWLGKSVSVVSCSTPGDTVKLDVDAISDWGTL